LARAGESIARVSKMARGKDLFCPTSACILCRICVCILIPDFLEIAHELPSLPNSTASGTFLHKPFEVRGVAWILIVPVWRRLGKYVTLHKTFYNIIVKQVVAATVVVCFGGGAYQHCSHEGLLYSNPPHWSSVIHLQRGAAHQAA
jgi:hypothetical protein